MKRARAKVDGMKENGFWAALALHGRNFPAYARKNYQEDFLRKELDRLADFGRRVDNLGSRVEELKKMHNQRIQDVNESQ